MVDTPSFSPDGGTFNEAKNVVITCATPGAGIHYTLDDSQPTHESPSVISGDMIPMSATATLKAKAFADGMVPSEIKSADFTFLIGALNIPPAEFDALVDLYHSTNGSNWTDHTNWLTENTPWFGVAIDNGHVTDIYLTENALAGAIPASIGNLTGLVNLFLGMNQLTGPIPATIGNLTSLQWLALWINQLDGPIPDEIGNMTSLRSLGVGANDLSGPIPSTIGNLTLLEDFTADNNNLSGEIPASIGNLTHLTWIGFGTNQLSGSIPPELGQLGNLEALGLSNNLLEGSIPADIGLLTGLLSLYLDSNLLSGEIPAELGDLTLLENLNLAGNQLHGEIPAELANLTNITSLNLGSNQLKASDLDLLIYLAAHAPWGEDSQTIEPTNLTVSGGDSSSVILTWQPIVYAWDDGYYEVGISDTPGGPYSFAQVNRTADKWASSLQIGDLTQGETYYFVVRTVTLPLWINPSTLTSDLSNEVSASPNALGVPQIEYEALVALYNSTDGDNWTDNTNWLTGTAPWFGVNTENGHVVELWLDNNQLSGPIPAELGDLANLRVLQLSDNQLTGDIPVELGGLANLVSMWMGVNQLTGSIPAELGQLMNLQSLSLSVNLLTGGIPPEIGALAHLKDLWLDRNQLTGSIPPALGGLAQLHILQLSDNKFSGSIPVELGNLTHLINLWLSNNQLSGPIPAELGDLAALESLSLMLNQLTGTIPPELGNLVNLTGLWLNRNQLSGAVPNMAGLTKMITFDLSTNGLTGPIPTWLENMVMLENLVMYRNQFTGPIPAELGNLTTLKQLSLSYNNLTGTIPSELNALTELNYLVLSGNELTGPIPAWLAGLTKLTSLALRINKLSGTIPSAFGGMTQLTALALSSNRFSGGIPTSFVNLTNISTLNGVKQLMLEYNCLTADDPGLISYLDTMDPGWALTQTVAPANVHLAGVGTGALSLAWNPISYTSDGGYYEVGISDTAGGPYSFLPANRTANKSAGTIMITGYDPGTVKYLVVRTFTPTHGAWNNPLSNKSDLTSGVSTETDPFELWISGWNWTVFTSPDLSATGDPDGDAMTNLQEFAFGLDPRSGASVNPIASGLIGNQFSYTKRIGTGLSYTVHYTTDLLTWSLDQSAVQTITGTHGDVDTVAVTLSSAAVPSGGKLFVRVQAD
jgi:Leucine-rich repeat (LRR) protein